MNARRSDRRSPWALHGSYAAIAINAVVVAAATSVGAWVWGTATQIAQVPQRVEALQGLPEQIKILEQNLKDIRKKDQDMQGLIDTQKDAYQQILLDHQELYKQLERRR